jgi:hypothetical protein
MLFSLFGFFLSNLKTKRDKKIEKEVKIKFSKIPSVKVKEIYILWKFYKEV